MIESDLKRVLKLCDFYESLTRRGLQYYKTPSKFGKSSAAIYLPKKFIGKTFLVSLIPIEQIDGSSMYDDQETKDKLNVRFHRSLVKTKTKKDSEGFEIPKLDEELEAAKKDLNSVRGENGN